MFWFRKLCALMVYHFLKESTSRATGGHCDLSVVGRLNPSDSTSCHQSLKIYRFLFTGLNCETYYIFQCMNSDTNIQLQISSTSSATIIKTSSRIDQNWSEPTTNSLGILSSLTLTISACSNVSSPAGRNIVMINTTVPVSIVAFVEQETNLHTLTLLRLGGLGKYYYVASWKPPHGYYAYVGITSLKDGTAVIFSLPKDTSATVDNQTYNDDQFIYRSLMRYQTLDIYSPDDLTGGYIIALHDVAVISGTTISLPSSSSDLHNNSVTLTGGTLEAPVMEMTTPLESWGKIHICFPFHNRTTAIKIIAGYEETMVTIESISTENSTSITLRNGQFITQSIKTLAVVTSSFPVMVMAYLLPGDLFDDVIPSSVVTLTPVEQWMRFHSFIIPKRELYFHFIDIMCETEAIGSFILDFEPLRAIWISENNYSGTSIPLSEGFHHIYNTIPSTTFSLFVYGLSELGTSYGYAVHMHMARLYDHCENSTSEADDGLDNDCDGAVDEELINELDDDEDGLVDEDCFGHFIPKAPATQTFRIPTNTETSPSVIDYRRQLSVLLVSMFMGPIICGLLGALLMVLINKLHLGAKVASNVKDDESTNQSTRYPRRGSASNQGSSRAFGVVDLEYV